MKKNHFVFLGGHCLREVFPILRHSKLFRGPAIHTSIDDLDLISKSQICQNHKLQIVFRFFSTVV